MISQTASAAGRGALALGAAALASYAAYVCASWLRYGSASPPVDGVSDPLLDVFMPAYDVVERHRIDVAAPAGITFGAMLDVDLNDSLVIRAIFSARERLLGASPDERPRESLIALTRSLGWVVLAEVPGHEIVMGAVTRPWEPNVVFRGVPAEEFAAFNEADYVKIAWTLRADAAGAGRSIARTETRAIATDASSRRKFRWYWAKFSAGIALIREIAQRLVREEAERRAAASATGGGTIPEPLKPDAYGPASE